MTRDTVFNDTPARAATSFMVTAMWPPLASYYTGVITAARRGPSCQCDACLRARRFACRVENPRDPHGLFDRHQKGLLVHQRIMEVPKLPDVGIVHGGVPAVQRDRDIAAFATHASAGGKAGRVVDPAAFDPADRAIDMFQRDVRILMLAAAGDAGLDAADVAGQPGGVVDVVDQQVGQHAARAGVVEEPAAARWRRRADTLEPDLADRAELALAHDLPDVAIGRKEAHHHGHEQAHAGLLAAREHGLHVVCLDRQRLFADDVAARGRGHFHRRAMPVGGQADVGDIRLREQVGHRVEYLAAALDDGLAAGRAAARERARHRHAEILPYAQSVAADHAGAEDADAFVVRFSGHGVSRPRGWRHVRASRNWPANRPGGRTTAWARGRSWAPGPRW